MTCTSDRLGRVWRRDQLDQILADADVERVVREAESIGYDAEGVFEPSAVEAWAKRQGRSRPGIALLFLLCWRSACHRRGVTP